jgi:drug/metabolite transporter (DMT)-like permease
MNRPSIVLLNLLIMLGYSVLFMILGTWLDEAIIGVNWAALGAHIIALFILGIVKLTKPETKKTGGQMLLAGLLVGIIGHGLCFFNGLIHIDLN